LTLTALGCGSHAQGGAEPVPDAGPPPSFPAPPPPPAPPLPFQADPASVYVAKVKGVLLGLPPTADEVSAVTADPTLLAPLIDGWMKAPEYGAKMLRFFELAFQQTQVTAVDFADQSLPGTVVINRAIAPLMVQNAEESFARTMLELIAEGKPLTQSVTTTQFMMTTALKEMYAFFDAWQVDDNGVITDRFAQANPKLQIVAEAAQGPIPLDQTLDPTSPNYMHWYDPDVLTFNASIPECHVDPVVYPANGFDMHALLMGTLPLRTLADGTYCPLLSGSASAPQLQASDFTDWTMVNVRPPRPGEAATPFYDLRALRGAKELVLAVPRVGFYSTPAFFANWHTNTSNTMRVTMNQTFIVALGSMVDGTDLTTPTGAPGLDTTHVTDAACYGCHKTLDPSRSIMSATWSWNYHNQVDPTWTQVPGEFAFRGVVKPMASVADLGSALASHAFFAPAWVEKLCYYANSAPCDPGDTSFKTIAADFAASGYSWNTLVRELLASPLVTNAVETSTASTYGQVVAVARRDHLCAALDARLGFADVCGLTTLYSQGTAAGQTIPQIVSGLPSDGYGRGAAAPVLPNQPSLFYRAATENLCEGVATQVIDVPAGQQVSGAKQWSSADPDGAIADFVSLLMGLTAGDPRQPMATSILQQHYQAALGQPGIGPTEALQSTFVAACLSPSFVGMGM
jgi:hypothetical protein